MWTRLLPVLMFAYLLNFLDRTNISLAKTHLDVDLGISADAFGFGAGVFLLAAPSRCPEQHPRVEPGLGDAEKEPHDVEGQLALDESSAWTRCPR